METVKESKEYTVFKKRSGRLCVKSAKGEYINGDEKVKILVAEKLLKVLKPKKKEEPAPEATPEAAPAEEPKAE